MGAEIEGILRNLGLCFFDIMQLLHGQDFVDPQQRRCMARVFGVLFVSRALRGWSPFCRELRVYGIGLFWLNGKKETL